MSCSAATAQPAANTPGAHWQCSAVGSGEATLLPEATLGGIVNRYAGLYSTRVLGLVQSKDGVYLLGTGGFASRVGLRADVISAGPARHEYVAQRHAFAAAPERGQAGASGFICLLDADAGRHGLARSGRGEVMLEAGKSVSLFDPYDPSLIVELTASEREPMHLREIAALSGRLGIYAGLMRQRRQANANIAVQGPGGEIVFKAVPDPLPPGATALALRGGVGLTVSDAVATKSPAPVAARDAVAASAAPVPEPRPSANVDKPAVAAATLAVPAPSRDSEGSYEYALRKLRERQGTGGVRSVSALTQVHPSVDALRALLR